MAQESLTQETVAPRKLDERPGREFFPVQESKHVRHTTSGSGCAVRERGIDRSLEPLLMIASTLS
eukprot:767736-Hanusia_phi.AAC.1